MRSSGRCGMVDARATTGVEEEASRRGRPGAEQRRFLDSKFGDVYVSAEYINLENWAYPEFGEIIASCSEDRVVSIWSCEEYDAEKVSAFDEGSTTTTRWRKRACLTDSSHAVTDIQFAPRRWGLKLASCSASGCVRTYEAMDPVNLATWVLEDVITVHRIRAGSQNTSTTSTAPAATPAAPTGVIHGSDGDKTGYSAVLVYKLDSPV
ncbi:nucleoporin seh1, putative [Perkinsus marinus ATCC 50983]|uniref:Nucleoporin seh1, putative n=1 Tax=Perkinsus marinus (strain ATCC 50983 / TXsc) TaxID=423536 RepID=C5LEX3_PERM5|nr:nucleoporin seh1, putative [Perkinsus marinus ATCC 50983]EER04739.1 nucleoporin seh1, putative [Perkinsus marinus ATCC 50983]|eukprot:XP_002772923.1 nucleoporin seh1, putative [Perkinsus marinus ATCC 50983]